MPNPRIPRGARFCLPTLVLVIGVLALPAGCAGDEEPTDGSTGGVAASGGATSSGGSGGTAGSNGGAGATGGAVGTGGSAGSGGQDGGVNACLWYQIADNLCESQYAYPGHMFRCMNPHRAPLGACLLVAQEASYDTYCCS